MTGEGFTAIMEEATKIESMYILKPLERKEHDAKKAK